MAINYYVTCNIFPKLNTILQLLPLDKICLFSHRIALHWSNAPVVSETQLRILFSFIQFLFCMKLERFVRIFTCLATNHFLSQPNFVGTCCISLAFLIKNNHISTTKITCKSLNFKKYIAK